ncbi:MAG TPA: cytochrome c3 family protein [Anaerolineales bacterium]
MKSITNERVVKMLKLKHTVLLGFLLLLGIVLSGCAADSQPGVTSMATRNPQAVAQATEAAAIPANTPPAVDTCAACHTDKQQLSDSLTADEKTAATSAGSDPVAKVLVDGDKFLKTVHGTLGCTNCHGGVQSTDKKAAHVGVVRNPSDKPEATCGKCHTDVVAQTSGSMHINLTGFWTAVGSRSLPTNHPALRKALTENCTSCHTTCGDCHVSQPASVGGGFVNGHLFSKNPSTLLNCGACHNTTVGNEYLGKQQGQAQSDVHYAQAKLGCVNCHTGQKMHGQTADCISCHKGPATATVKPKEHLYDGVQAPRCESCHINVSTGQDGVIFHQMHGSKLSCQVCHSVPYSNNNGYQITADPKTGKPVVQTEPGGLIFLIGRNPDQNYERPYTYVPVRHIPLARDTFNFYGKDLLSNFDALITWMIATPHNIQLRTPQTASCNACHGNAALFLTSDKVAPDELQANQKVITTPPPLIGSDGLLK